MSVPAAAEGPLWRPPPERVSASRLTAFIRTVEEAEGRSFTDYSDLHRWSVGSVAEFWTHVWNFCGVIGQRGGAPVIDHPGRLPGAKFFPDSRLNFAENLLRRRDEATAIIATTEQGRDREVSFGDLYRAVARGAQALRRAGVGPGDRVCGVVANVPEAVIAALSAAAIGAIWSSCSPDFGVDGIVNRFEQIAPLVLVGVDGYFYGGRYFDCREKLGEVARRIPTLKEIVLVSMSADPQPWAGPIQTIGWDEWLTRETNETIDFEAFEFNHPLYILYSSGTTGSPKCLVHGAGGTLLEHLKEHQLQTDIRPSDRVFYFTTCGWMMWNWLVSALASSATLVLYDGSPAHPDGRRLFDFAASAGVTMFGTSARFIHSIRKAGLQPRATSDLRSIRTISSTGSPLAPEGFDFVYDSIKPDVHLASISGGTDLVGCFVGGNPNGPVWRGEIQAPGLGMDVRAFDETGHDAGDAAGELVCATAFPSMPVRFWNDPDCTKYRAAYFDRFPGVWHHGDWIRPTRHAGFVIDGRSDATLNPGGVRIGTAELYQQVEQIPEVLESLAVGQRWESDERVILFVRLAPDVALDDLLRRRIRARIRTHLSPRHVPAHILQVADLPRTRSGKIVELAVRRVIHGEPILNREALANPEALDFFRDLPELAS
ncbi:MAG TPA: acetoacetate--CoA ligase [Vicinamibacterales bacterium]|jgi:acetoacetyl-CoA synthetase|nr:acetoacetate--CoA ligase [Vicinamibacterales bacterium]